MQTHGSYQDVFYIQVFTRTARHKETMVLSRYKLQITFQGVTRNFRWYLNHLILLKNKIRWFKYHLNSRVTPRIQYKLLNWDLTVFDLTISYFSLLFPMLGRIEWKIRKAGSFSFYIFQNTFTDCYKGNRNIASGYNRQRSDIGSYQDIFHIQGIPKTFRTNELVLVLYKKDKVMYLCTTWYIYHLNMLHIISLQPKNDGEKKNSKA